MKQPPHVIKGKARGCAQATSINVRTRLTARVALAAVLQACSGDQKQCGHQLKRGLESRSTKEHLGIEQWHRHWPTCGDEGIGAEQERQGSCDKDVVMSGTCWD